MPTTVTPYLFFEGRCEEALAFYEQALGAQRGALMRYRDNPEPQACPDRPAPAPDKVMHGAMTVGGTEIFLSDGMASGTTRFQGFGLAITLATVEEVERRCAALAAGGQVTMAPTKTFYSPRFAMVTDRFGMQWMLLAQPAP